MKIVTRFIGNKKWFDADTNTVSSAAYYTTSNKKYGEISVFDIDTELKNGDENKIYEIGDKKVYKRPPHTIARADLNVSEVVQIHTNNGNLKVVKGFFHGKHCNIKPFPKDASALNVAGQLARISALHIKHK